MQRGSTACNNIFLQIAEEVAAKHRTKAVTSNQAE